MICFARAAVLLKEYSTPKRIEHLPVLAALDRVLSEDVFAVLDSPPHDQSAMDGFAFRAKDTTAASAQHPIRLSISGESFAGDTHIPALPEQHAMRITTGALLPAGADAVVAREDVTEHDGCIDISTPIRMGKHIRFRGEEVRRSDIALPRGTKLTPAGIGHVLALGVSHVPVYATPRIGILPTGSELISDLKQWQPGAVIESNARMLCAAVQQDFRIEAQRLAAIGDDSSALHTALQSLIAEQDVAIISGGVSVGERDLVKQALLDLGVTPLFWKVAQKPGKPLFCGIHARGMVFGLPGNPAAALTCYYLYVRPVIAGILGWPETSFAADTGYLSAEYSKSDERSHFLRARADWNQGRLEVHVLPQQESHCLSAFALANCLAEIPLDANHMPAGAAVKLHWLHCTQ